MMIKEFKSFKYMKHSFKNCFIAPQSFLNTLFQNSCSPFYNAGIYGWNCDFIVDYRTDSCLAIGCRVPKNFGIKLDSNLCKDFEERYIRIYDKFPNELNFSEVQKYIYILQSQLFTKLTENI